MVGYKSVNVAGYPNLFWIMGPNSFGHSSLLLFIEEQVGYAMRGVKQILDNNLREFDVRARGPGRPQRAAPAQVEEDHVRVRLPELVSDQGRVSTGQPSPGP